MVSLSINPARKQQQVFVLPFARGTFFPLAGAGFDAGIGQEFVQSGTNS